MADALPASRREKSRKRVGVERDAPPVPDPEHDRSATTDRSNEPRGAGRSHGRESRIALPADSPATGSTLSHSGSWNKTMAIFPAPANVAVHVGDSPTSLTAEASRNHPGPMRPGAGRRGAKYGEAGHRLGEFRNLRPGATPRLAPGRTKNGRRRLSGTPSPCRENAFGKISHLEADGRDHPL